MSVKLRRMLDNTKQPKQKQTHSVHKLEPAKVSFVVRKMLRSKKLTRLLRLLRARTATLQLSSISELMRTSQLDTTTLANPTPIPKQMPCFLGDPPPSGVDTPKDPLVFPSIRVSTIKSALVTGHSSLIAANNRMLHHDLFDVCTHIVSDEVHQRVELKPIDRTGLRIAYDSKPYRLTKAATFTDSVSTNYAHWLTEVLPRMVVLDAHHAFDDIPYIVDADLHANLYRSLELTIGRSRDIYLLPKDRQILVSDLLCVSPTGYIPFEPRGPKVKGHSHGIFSSEALHMSTELVKSRLGLAGAQGPKRKIYVRRNSNIRNMQNSADVEQALVNIGFEVVEPEKLTFDEQVRVFNSADVVVGATGAALANIIFCGPQCKVFILISAHPDMPYFYWQNMAVSTGVKLTYVLGEPVGSPELGVHADFVIPDRQLQRLCQAVQTS